MPAAQMAQDASDGPVHLISMNRPTGHREHFMHAVALTFAWVHPSGHTAHFTWFDALLKVPGGQSAQGCVPSAVVARPGMHPRQLAAPRRL